MIDLLRSVIDAAMHQEGVILEALKTQPDIDRYQAIIDNVRPDFIIETGTMRGGSALWFADTAGCPVITIDIRPHVHFEMIKMWNGRVTNLIASSTDLEIVKRVTERVADCERVMVVLDSNHDRDHVYTEMNYYGPLVPVGSYMVVEDTLARHMPWYDFVGSPWDAVDTFMKFNSDEWENDLKIEEMSDRSQNPSGWLKRMAPLTMKTVRASELPWSHPEVMARIGTIVDDLNEGVTYTWDEWCDQVDTNNFSGTSLRERYPR